MTAPHATTRWAKVSALMLCLFAAACEGNTGAPTQPSATVQGLTGRFATTPGPNLILNPGLETAGTNGDPANWSRAYWGSQVPTFTYPVTGNSSTRAARVRLAANSTGGARFQPAAVVVTPGVTYNYSEWYNSDVASQVDIEYTMTSGALTYDWVASPASSGGAWKQLTASIVIPAGVAKITVYHLITSKGSLTIDNVSLASATVLPPAAPTVSLSASPANITTGQSSTLTWLSTNSTSCSATGAWSGTRAVSGSTVVTPTATSTYTLSCTGTGGTTAQTATVTVSTTTPPSSFTQGMVTFSLDDSWLSQYVNALPILQAAGIKGTFYLTTTPLVESWQYFMTPTQVIDIAAKGHEIAGHTLTHPDLTTLTQANIDAQIADSRRYLQTLTGAPVNTFAYPYGFRNALVKSRVPVAGYSSARTVDLPGLNDATTDKYELRSITLLSSQTLADITSQVDLAKANKQWLILTIHEVNTGGDAYFTTPTRLQQIVNYVKSSGIKIVTIGEGRALMPN